MLSRVSSYKTKSTSTRSSSRSKGTLHDSFTSFNGQFTRQFDPNHSMLRMESLVNNQTGHMDESQNQIEENGFVVINDMVDPAFADHDATNGSGQQLERHEDGYPIAVRSLCKIIKSSIVAINMAGGHALTKCGTMVVQRHANSNGINLGKVPGPIGMGNPSLLHMQQYGKKRKYVIMKEGKIRVFTMLPSMNINSYVEGEEVDIEDLKKDSSFPIQRIRAIKYGSLAATSFVVVFIKPKQEKAKAVPKFTMKRMKGKHKSGPNDTSNNSFLGLSLKKGKLSNNVNTSSRSVRSISANSQNTLNSYGVDSVNSSMQKNGGVKSNTLFRLRFNAGTSKKFKGQKNVRKNKKNKNNQQENNVSQNQIQTQVGSSGSSAHEETLYGADDMQSVSSATNTTTLGRFSSNRKILKTQSMKNLSSMLRNKDKNKVNAMKARGAGTTVSALSNESASSMGTHFSHYTTATSDTFLSNDTSFSHIQRTDSNGSRNVMDNIEVTKSSKQNGLVLTDDNGNPLEIEEESVEFRFDTAENCQEWLKTLLVEVENQALMFSAYSEIMKREGKDGSGENNLETVLRYAVDLFTLARGVRDVKVWKAREKLATFLEEKKDYDEARLWFEMSQALRNNSGTFNEEDPTRDTKISQKSYDTNASWGSGKKSSFSFFDNAVEHSSSTVYTSQSNRNLVQQNNTIRNKLQKHKKPKTRDEAFYNLVLFLEQYGHGRFLHDAGEEARLLFEKYELTEVAKRVEREYGRVPEGYEAYLAEASKSPFELMQEEAGHLQTAGRDYGMSISSFQS